MRQQNDLVDALTHQCVDLSLDDGGQSIDVLFSCGKHLDAAGSCYALQGRRSCSHNPDTLAADGDDRALRESSTNEPGLLTVGHNQACQVLMGGKYQVAGQVWKHGAWVKSAVFGLGAYRRGKSPGAAIKLVVAHCGRLEAHCVQEGDVTAPIAGHAQQWDVGPVVSSVVTRAGDVVVS